MFQAGDSLGRYTIQGVLGAGGMGQVYRAFDPNLHRRVALKVLKHETGTGQLDSQAKERLLREARAAASLNHPNAVSIFEVDETDGTLYVAMEYIEGATLRSLLSSSSTPWTRKLRWLLDAARALEAAHRAGIVHRDVKPENIMVRNDGVVKVLDFGIARRVEGAVDPESATEHANLPPLTQEGALIGTPLYMAPEQLRGGVVTGHADQFAWGVVAYELLTGENPWTQSAGVPLLAIVDATPNPISSLRPEVPLPVALAIARALEKKPADRFPSMATLIDALEPFVVEATRSDAERLELKSASVAEQAVASANQAGYVDPGRGVSTTGAVASTASSTLPSATPRRRWPILPTILGAAALLAAALGLPKLRASWMANTTSPAGSSSAAPRKNDQPASDNPEAARAYSEAMQLWRDGASGRKVRKQLEHALGKDSSLAAAHLRLGLLALQTEPEKGRTHFQEAFQHRARLTEHDRSLLDAAEPYFRATVDLPEFERRLTAIAGSGPADPEIQYWLGTCRLFRDDLPASIAAYDRALEADRSFAPAWWLKGQAIDLMGKSEASRQTYDECLRISPIAAVCLYERIRSTRYGGPCEKVEADARAWVALEPDSPSAHWILAEALAARGAPRDAIQASVAQALQVAPSDERQLVESAYEAGIALFYGEFADAERLLPVWSSAVSAKTRVDSSRARPMSMLALLHEEQGRMDRAAEVAQKFLGVSASLVKDPLEGDPAITFDALLFRAGRLSKAAFDEKRGQWVKEQTDRLHRQETKESFAFQVWLDAYADPTETAAEALEAREVLPRFGPVPPWIQRALAPAAIGKVYALSGKTDEAIPYLTTATRSCVVLTRPIEQTRAHYFLGLALEAKGDKEAAQKAYQVVVDRWGKAKPRSLTAEKARARIAVLDKGK